LNSIFFYPFLALIAAAHLTIKNSKGNMKLHK